MEPRDRFNVKEKSFILDFFHSQLAVLCRRPSDVLSSRSVCASGHVPAKKRQEARKLIRRKKIDTNYYVPPACKGPLPSC